MPTEQQLLDELAKCNDSIAEVEHRYRDASAPLLLDRRRLLLGLASLFHGVTVGCGVKEGGKLYQVTEIQVLFLWDDYDVNRMKQYKPWVKGCPVKKDGSVGTREFQLYGDWEII